MAIRYKTFSDFLANNRAEDIRIMAPLSPIKMAFMGIAVYEPDVVEMRECKIDESRYRIKDGYKMTLVDAENGPYASHNYYIRDFRQMSRRAHEYQFWLLDINGNKIEVQIG